MNRIERLREKSNTLPASPGVYIMKDADGRIIYVGKSRKLKNRVNSYFTGSGHGFKTEKMISCVDDFEYYLCNTEIEALTLENVLIKKHSPKYNIKLKDSKSYPYIKITAGAYPRVIVTRDRKQDGGMYFGPYQGSESAHLAADAVIKIFSLPTCKRSFPRDIGKERPCIYSQMGRCCAPCAGGISEEEYSWRIKAAAKLLDGNIRETKERLVSEMNSAAEAEEYERAARLRDSVAALEKLSEKQLVVADPDEDRDIFAFYTDEVCGVFAVLNIRGGKLINKSEFVFSCFEMTEDGDKAALITRYYADISSVPREIFLCFEIDGEERESLSEYLAALAGHRVQVRTPSRGAAGKLCRLAIDNARERAKNYRNEAEREEKRLVRLSELLRLEVVPDRIEAYDISNIGNENINASMIVYENGKFKRSDYRRFNIKTTAGADDYGSMREALSRRFSHIGDGSPSLGERPDLILVDGGAGQVNAALSVMPEGLSIPVFGMVKDDYHKTRALTDGNGEISIASDKGIYVMIYEIQEEAHRFAVSATMKGKRRTLTHSSLEKIPGIGAAKARRLLSGIGSLSGIKAADVEQLCGVPGISRRDAENIYEYFRKK